MKFNNLNQRNMTRKISLLFLFGSFFFSNQIFSQEKANIKYDLSCFNKDGTSTMVNDLGRLGSLVWDIAADDLSVADEETYGDEFLADLKSKSKFINSGPHIEKVRMILKKLNANILKPRGFHYKIYLLDTNILNAFTFGGKIFITEEMFNFCKNDDEIACILGHEISHNELGHISEGIKKRKLTTEYLGNSFGSIASIVGKIISTPFNQVDEAYSDMRGMDIAYAAGYNICENQKLWKRMAENEGKYNSLMTLMSTHPYSGTRAECARNHIVKNYSIKCRD